MWIIRPCCLFPQVTGGNLRHGSALGFTPYLLTSFLNVITGRSFHCPPNWQDWPVPQTQPVLPHFAWWSKPATFLCTRGLQEPTQFSIYTQLCSIRGGSAEEILVFIPTAPSGNDKAREINTLWMPTNKFTANPPSGPQESPVLSHWISLEGQGCQVSRQCRF